jgi:hypothetical protein
MYGATNPVRGWTNGDFVESRFTLGHVAQDGVMESWSAGSSDEWRERSFESGAFFTSRRLLFFSFFGPAPAWHWPLLIRECFKFGKIERWKWLVEGRLRREMPFKFVSSCFKFVSEGAGVQVVGRNNPKNMCGMAENAGEFSGTAQVGLGKTGHNRATTAN